MSVILFVDDDPDTLVIYQKAMNLVEQEALLVGSGKQALATALDTLPDLIVLDLQLSDMNGLTLIEQLRTEKSTSEIPIIVLSASFPHEVEDKVLSAGADVFLSKPISLKAFFSILEEYL